MKENVDGDDTPSARDPRRDTEVDLLVVGSGTGMAAALAAHELGLSTLVVEKTEYVGGSTARSGGAFWLPANPILEESGAGDSRPARPDTSDPLSAIRRRQIAVRVPRQCVGHGGYVAADDADEVLLGGGLLRLPSRGAGWIGSGPHL